MTTSALKAVSPIDGRYASKTNPLSSYFSEYALIYYRLLVEIRWLETLASIKEIKELPPFDNNAKQFLQSILTDFNETEAAQVKAYEKKSNHDVKAVEYYLRDKIQSHHDLAKITSFVHFGCTSEDINNLAYALMLKDGINQVILPILAEISGGITMLGKQYGAIPMLSRTHGQPATPTTMGKELINFVARLKRPLQQLAEVFIPGKFNGAVGNYNAHIIAYPDVDWRKHSALFVTQLGLSFNAYTTQIEPHDGIAEVSHLMIRVNNILLNYAQDIWGYVSLGYFKQKITAEEVGSSTMPHKVNPIDFENAEGNLGLANALFDHFAAKLTRSRFQRDLSDSTVLRNLGVAFGYAFIAYQAIAKGNEKLQINEPAIKADVENCWEVTTEAIQTVMRKHHITDAYEQIRDLARGNAITHEQLIELINALSIPEEAKANLKKLSPENYTGLASLLVKAFS